MSLQNLRHNPFPSIWDRPDPTRPLSREERVQTRGRVLRARVHIYYHPRRLRVITALQPLFRQVEKRRKARNRVLRQVRVQREKLPLGVWQAAIGHALNETEHPEGVPKISVPSAIEEEDDAEEDTDYDPAKLTEADSSESDTDSGEDLEAKEAADESKKKRKLNAKRIERRIRREAARHRRIECRTLRFSPGDTDDEEAKLVRKHEATTALLAADDNCETEQQALKDLRNLKRPKVKPAKRVKPTLLIRRIQPELVESVELPSDDSGDEDYTPEEGKVENEEEMGEEGEALKARIGEKAESSSDEGDEEAENAADEAMDEDEDELDDEMAGKDTSLETVDTGATAETAAEVEAEVSMQGE